MTQRKTTLSTNSKKKKPVKPKDNTLRKSHTAVLKKVVKPKGTKRNVVQETSVEYAVTSKFRFIDLFCGIGGFRIGFERAGCECVFSSDWDKYSQVTYEANFGEKPYGDIRTVPMITIPEHDILCAGFPCQPFSIAGVSKKNSLGRKHGFEDEKQGNLFFSLADILSYHRPPAFVLENVKNLKGHDGGKTFAIIYRTLTESLGYTVYYKIIDARNVVPQHRERIFFVGFREKRYFEFPEFPVEGPKLGAILEDKPDPKYTLTNHLWQYLQDYSAKHRAAGNGFGFNLVTEKDTTRTLSARYHKDGSEILVAQKGPIPRRLTPRECARLMGYPESYKIVVSDTQAYRQFGNSIVVPVIERVAKAVCETLRRPIGEIPPLVLKERKQSDEPIVLMPKKLVNYSHRRATVQAKGG